MGLISSRLNLEGLPSGRRRSQQEETFYSYSLNKNYFSNYFLMGGERFEVSDPDYLFGDNCDLNFLSCTKPYSLPYKKAQQNLLSNLNTKQKTSNKVSSRVNRFSSPFDILTGRHRQASRSRKQDAQTQTLHSLKSLPNGPEPSQPIVMFINIRKETLRLVKSSNFYNIDSDQNSLANNSASISNTGSKLIENDNPITKRNSLDQSASSSTATTKQRRVDSIKRHSVASSRVTTPTIHQYESKNTVDNKNDIELDQTDYCAKKTQDSDSTSISSHTPSSSSPSSSGSSTKSGYTSVRDVPPSDCASDENDEDFEDALNDTTNLSTKDDDDDDSERAQQQKALLRDAKSTKENRDIKITIKPLDDTSARNSSDTEQDLSTGDHSVVDNMSIEHPGNSRKTSSENKSPVKKATDKKLSVGNSNLSNRVYNIEFYFDSEVDCSIRIFYFCTREINSTGVTYKPQHATYKSKTYTFKRGLNQKFEQQEHTFQPYLFDEDLLIYKPLDLDGNYNSGAVFPIVIHCVALDGSVPRQSHSLVATVEKSQLDDSYSIKPLKQLIFVDGVQYILQDIYGIENKRLPSSSDLKSLSMAPRPLDRSNRNLRASSGSLQSNYSTRSNLNLGDNASMRSYDTSLGEVQYRGSLISDQYKSLGGENTFECVICMSEERDTMLLPCRHLCLCSSCAQSLRYQASSCPICRCPFKAALNLRVLHKHHRRSWQTTTTTTSSEDNRRAADNDLDSVRQGSRRESLVTNSATPLLLNRRDNQVVLNIDNNEEKRVSQAIPQQQQQQQSFTEGTPVVSRQPSGTIVLASSLSKQGTGNDCDEDRRRQDASMKPVEPSKAAQGAGGNINSTSNGDSNASEVGSLEMKSMRWNLVGGCNSSVNNINKGSSA